VLLIEMRGMRFRSCARLRRTVLIHQDLLVRRLPVDCCTPVAGSSLSGEESTELERLLRSLADRHRLRILNMLVHAGAPVCVCEFTAELELPQQNVSYHLKQLVDAGVIKRERRGRYSYYRLVEGALDHIAALVALPERVAA
jgi:ArsR family transcriptional regulator, arsenate/arsenite/antimonite-responsive transcriptional repressor